MVALPDEDVDVDVDVDEEEEAGKEGEEVGSLSLINDACGDADDAGFEVEEAEAGDTASLTPSSSFDNELLLLLGSTASQGTRVAEAINHSTAARRTFSCTSAPRENMEEA